MTNSFFSKIAVVLTIASTSVVGQAQVRSAVFGRTTVQLSQSFSSTVANLGGSLADLNLVPLVNNAFTAPVKAGVFNPSTGAGELEHSAGFAITGGGKAVRLENFIFDSSNGAPVISAVYVFNDAVIGRFPLFNITFPSNLSLPLPVTVGVLQVSGLGLTLAPAAATELNMLFGLKVVPAGLDAGTANVYAVFSPLADGSL